MPDPSVPGSAVVGGRRVCRRHADRGGLAPVFITSSWLLARLVNVIPQDRRAGLLEAMADAVDLTVEIHCTVPAIRVRDGEKLLVNIPVGIRRG